MFNRDILEHRHHASLPVEDQETFSRQVEGLLNMVGDMWPEAKTVFLEVHPLNSDDLKVKHIWGGGYFNPPLDATQDSPLLPPLFAQRRLVQHSMALKAGAKAAGVDTLDVSCIRAARDTQRLTRAFAVLEAQGLVQRRRLLGTWRCRSSAQGSTRRHGRHDARKDDALDAVRGVEKLGSGTTAVRDRVAYDHLTFRMGPRP